MEAQLRQQTLVLLDVYQHNHIWYSPSNDSYKDLIQFSLNNVSFTYKIFKITF